ncbi:MAG: PorV/PorQ family protein [Lentimicrobiaceae bacterium]|nr:PorV/PorQ family protein [Lentimicrobiaceae bacterium]
MKKILNKIVIITVVAALLLPGYMQAGNKDRSGEAGASQLLINPWAKSSGWNGANVACAFGLESLFSNVAGLAFTPGTEVSFNHTQWLKGAEIGIYNIGIAQRVGPGSVLGASIMTMNFGDIPITRVDLPEGGVGNFSPRYLVINLAYAKAFSNSIYGGFNFKIINESMSNLSASGVAIDAGIQYVTGIKENIKFGIALKNIGPTMRYTGDGLSIQTFLPGNSNQFTMDIRSSAFELPTQLFIGGSYALDFAEIHQITFAGAFVSNAFGKDQFVLGLEYSLSDYLQVRGAYTYEDGILDNAKRTTVFTGPSAGITVQAPLNSDKSSVFAVDYSYRATNPFGGVHNIAARLNF